MSDVDIEITLAPRVKTMRIIVIALLNGIMMFAGIAVYMRAPGGMPAPPEVPMLTYLALVLAVPMVLAALLVPRLIESAAIAKVARRGADDNLAPMLAIFQQRLIVRVALFEGPAFFALIAYMLEAQWPTLVIAGAMALGIASNFPSVAGVLAWLDERREQLAEARAAS